MTNLPDPITFGLDAAISQAHKAFQNNLVPIGAALIYNNKIISQAHNGISPLEHAELIVLNDGIKQLGHKINECILCVTIEPCQMCLGAISLSNLKSVYFGAYNEKSINNPNISIYGGFQEQECTKLMTMFFQMKRSY